MVFEDTLWKIFDICMFVRFIILHSSIIISLAILSVNCNAFVHDAVAQYAVLKASS